MSWSNENIATDPEKLLTPISLSDISHADDKCPMSGPNHSRNSSPQLGLHLGGESAQPSALVSSKTSAVSMSNLIETTRQQQDRDFFEKFLRTPARNSGAALHEAGLNGRRAVTEPSSIGDQPSPSQASFIDQLLPQFEHQSALLRSGAYLINPMNSTFGAMSINYPRDGHALLAAASSKNQRQFAYADTNLASSAGGPDVPGKSNHFNNNQLNASDSSNIFSSNSNFSSNYSGGPFQNESQGGDAALEKTYPSVLHPIMQRARLAALQQQSPDELLIFGAQQQKAQSITGGELFAPADGLQPMMAQTNNSGPSRLMDVDLFAGQNQRGQAPKQAHYQPHPGRPSGHQPSMYNRSATTSLGASTNYERQPAAGPARAAQMRNSLNDKTAGSNMMLGACGSPASTNRRPRNKSPFFSGSSKYLGEGQQGYKLDAHGTGVVNSDESERFSRKVFVGGLPPDIDEEEIKASFRRFGTLVVDWPHKAESKSYFPPKGYAFLLFQEESSVQSLIDSCFQEEDKLYLCVSSPTIKDKPVQIRPWRLSDSDFVLDSTLTLDPRKTVFVGGVPRPLKASELATIMNNLYGCVCYAGIDTDPELKYPKGAGRVAFSNYQSYIAAISARFVHIHHSEIEKRVEVKPYVLDDQFCDECQGFKCNNKFAPFFCANITCLRYYCDSCWTTVHSMPGKEFHKPLVKEGGDRPRGAQSYKW